MRIITAPLLLLALTVACSSDGPDASAPTDASQPDMGQPDMEQSNVTGSSGFPAGWTPGPTDWGPCKPEVAEGIECAVLEVPLDWSEPSGPTIDLALARTEATGERLGSLLTNPGGPGGSGIGFLARSPLGAELGEHFDIVSWDPRGVGRSTSVECDEHTEAHYLSDPTPEGESERAAAEQAASRVVADCTAAGGALLEHLYTEEVARDLEAIRQSLGSERLNYLGFSYGTHIGQEYAELFGDRVRAMVLDGVVDPALGFEEFLIGQAEAFDAAFERQAHACDRSGKARCGVTGLIEAYDTVMSRAEASEIEAGGQPLEPAQVAIAAVYTGYTTDGWTLLGPALGEALDGDGSELAQLAGSYTAMGAYGPYAGVVCIDTSPPQGLAQYREFTERAAEVSPRFGASIASEMLPCATWPVGPKDTAEPLTAPDAPPILVVGNTGDPATPLVNAESVARSLTRGVLVVVESEGHTAYGSDPCATKLIDAYFVDSEVPETGTRC